MLQMGLHRRMGSALPAAAPSPGAAKIPRRYLGSSSASHGPLRVVYFDLETTGFSHKRDRVIELGAYDPQEVSDVHHCPSTGDRQRLERFC